MDLDFWDCFGRKKICLITEEIRYLFWGMLKKNHRFIIRTPFSAPALLKLLTTIVYIDTQDFKCLIRAKKYHILSQKKYIVEFHNKEAVLLSDFVDN